ncbi:MAG: GDSL-type esterase/lipase family protein [Eubacteriales bacterium]|nr:GDSL-type esterase/lipase family protein [Eubacteriales bacterium]
MRRNWYTIFLLCSLVLAAALYIVPDSYVFWRLPGAGTEGLSAPEDGNASAADPEEAGGTFQKAERVPEELPQAETSPEEEIPQEPAGEETPSGQEIPSDFTGVLFIGDSRTVGLSEYGNLGNAQVFADSGMSVYNVLKKKLPGPDGTARTLEELLTEQSYRAVLLMLGINELGYDHTASLQKYGELAGRIRELQPDAILVLEANLHVTAAQSAKDPIFNNDNINLINDGIRQIAGEQGCLYLDVNALFDDGEGNLDQSYSVDGAHVLGKYYDDWSAWILEQLQEQE